MANLTTAGYKRKVHFAQSISFQDTLAPSTLRPSIGVDFSPGKQIDSGNPFDVAILGEGFFAVRSGASELYTRDGQFRRDDQGRLVTAQGLPVQASGGGELVLKPGDFEIAADGAVLQGGELVGKLAVVQPIEGQVMTPIEGGLFAALPGSVTAVRSPTVRQGALEASNVSTGDEMIAIMEALRRAESGQRLMNVYDDLMGRALAAFGQA